MIDNGQRTQTPNINMDKNRVDDADPMLQRRLHHLIKESDISFLERLKFPTYRRKFLHTIWICCAFTMLGWVEGMFGPTFPDLRAIIDENLETASWLFTATPAGFLLGSVVTGLLYEKYNKALLLVVSILGAAGASAAVPWCTQFSLMLIARFLYGSMSASLDTGGNSEIVQLWGKDVGTYMQALHFCFAFGGMISPLVAEPFLAGENTVSSNETRAIGRNASNYIVSSASVTPEDKDGLTLNNATLQFYPEKDAMKSYVHYAYLITAILTAMTSIPFLITYLKSRDEKQKVKQAEDNRDPTNFKTVPMYLRLLILLLLSSMMFLYCGTEDTFAGFLMTFCISQLNWSKSSGSFATSVHWICFGFTRLGAIYFVRFIPTTKLLFIFSLLMVLSFSCLLISSLFNITALIWIFIGCSGFSMSVVFPAIFTWTNERIVTVSGRISAMFLTSAALGVMLFPLLFGYMMERFSSIWFLYLLVGQSAIWVVLYSLTILLIGNLKPSPMEVNVHVEEKEMIAIQVENQK